MSYIRGDSSVATPETKLHGTFDADKRVYSMKERKYSHD